METSEAGIIRIINKFLVWNEQQHKIINRTKVGRACKTSLLSPSSKNYRKSCWHSVTALVESRHIRGVSCIRDYRRERSWSPCEWVMRPNRQCMGKRCWVRGTNGASVRRAEGWTAAARPAAARAGSSLGYRQTTRRSTSTHHQTDRHTT